MTTLPAMTSEEVRKRLSSLKPLEASIRYGASDVDFYSWVASVQASLFKANLDEIFTLPWERISNPAEGVDPADTNPYADPENAHFNTALYHIILMNVVKAPLKLITNNHLLLSKGYEVLKLLKDQAVGASEVRLQSLLQQYQCFKVGQGESWTNIQARYRAITDNLEHMNERVPMKHQIYKLLAALADDYRFEAKAKHIMTEKDIISMEDLCNIMAKVAIQAKKTAPFQRPRPKYPTVGNQNRAYQCDERTENTKTTRDGKIKTLCPKCNRWHVEGECWLFDGVPTDIWRAIRAKTGHKLTPLIHSLVTEARGRLILKDGNPDDQSNLLKVMEAHLNKNKKRNRAQQDEPHRHRKQQRGQRPPPPPPDPWQDRAYMVKTNHRQMHEEETYRLDSASGCHITNDQNDLHNLKHKKMPELDVVGIGGELIECQGMGTIRVLDDGGRTLDIQNVRYCPNAESKILSSYRLVNEYQARINITKASSTITIGSATIQLRYDHGHLIIPLNLKPQGYPAKRTVTMKPP